MDVRCQKCQTVYEFDDSTVGPHGVNVKCTQCGHLFRVRRRDAPPPTPSEPSFDAAVPRSRRHDTPRGVVPPIEDETRTEGTSPGPGRTRNPAQAPGQQGWLLRVASGEVHDVRDWAELQKWIVERRVTAADEISRSGENWRRLGTIGELHGLFTDRPGLPSAPPPEQISHHATPPPLPKAPPPRLGQMPPLHNPPLLSDESIATLDPESLEPFEAPRRRLLWGLGAVGVFLVGAVGLGAWRYQDVHRFLFSRPQEAANAAELGWQSFAKDTEADYREAVKQFKRALKEDDRNRSALGGLTEVHATWAFYLDQAACAGIATAESAKTHLAYAQTFAERALALGEAAETRRAIADLRRVAGASRSEVLAELQRTREPGTAADNDAELSFLRGALALRDAFPCRRDANSRPDPQLVTEAKINLGRALALNGLHLRAQYLFAKYSSETGDLVEGKRLVEDILAKSPGHTPAQDLLALIDDKIAHLARDGGQDGATDGSTDAGGTATTATTKPNPSAPKNGPPGAAVEDLLAKGDYTKLVQAADRVLESGKTEAARKLYERALQTKPDGIEAQSGLGYCDLDSERFLAAVDRFKRVLSDVPNYGPALIGLAESYKVRGQKARSLEYYQRYVDAVPSGPRAEMAKKNIRELQSEAPESEKPPAPPPPPEVEEKPVPPGAE